MDIILNERDLEGFSIDWFIAICIELDSVDIILMCQNFRILVQDIKQDINPNKTVEDFARFIFHLEVIIKKQEVGKPTGMRDENFFKVKPIIEKLVISGYLRKNWLSLI